MQKGSHTTRNSLSTWLPMAGDYASMFQSNRKRILAWNDVRLHERLAYSWHVVRRLHNSPFRHCPISTKRRNAARHVVASSSLVYLRPITILFFSQLWYFILFGLYTWMANRYYSFFQVQKESACRARSNASQILQRMRMNVCYWRRIPTVKWYFVPLERYQRSAFIGLDVVLKQWHPTTCAHHLGSDT